jgi:hypothetical protein
VNPDNDEAVRATLTRLKTRQKAGMLLVGGLMPERHHYAHQALTRQTSPAPARG